MPSYDVASNIRPALPVTVPFRMVMWLPPAATRESRTRSAAPRSEVHPVNAVDISVTRDSVMLSPPPSRFAVFRNNLVSATQGQVNSACCVIGC